MPDRYLPTTDASLQIDSEMQKLTEKLQVLKQEQILPPEKARVLEKDLSRIRHEAEANDPAKTMEALDHVEQSFSKAASQAAEVGDQADGNCKQGGRSGGSPSGGTR